jgi:hypothetical protein
MAYLFEIMATKYADLPINEKETEMRKEMIRGLVRFTRGDLQVQIVQAIEFARKKKDKIDWKILMEKAIEAEMTQGMPQTDIKFKNNDMDDASTHKLYNVCTGISSNPRYEPKVTPGKGEYGRREQETEQKTAESPYSDYGEDYPAQSELIKELENTQKRNYGRQGDNKQEEKTRDKEDSGKIPHREDIDDICEKLKNLYKDKDNKDDRRKSETDTVQKTKEPERRSSTRDTKKPDRFKVNAIETKDRKQSENKQRSTSISSAEGKSTTSSRDSSRDRRTQNRSRDREYNKKYDSRDRRPRNNDRYSRDRSSSRGDQKPHDRDNRYKRYESRDR